MMTRARATADWTEAQAFAKRLQEGFEGMHLVEVDAETITRHEENRNVTIQILHKKLKRYGREPLKIGTVTVRERESSGGYYYSRRCARLDVDLCPPWSTRGGHDMPPRRQFKILNDTNYVKTMELVARCKALLEREKEMEEEAEQTAIANAEWIKKWAKDIAGRIPGMVASHYYDSRWRLKKGDVALIVDAKGEDGFVIEGSIVNVEYMLREHATFDLFKRCYLAERDIYKLAHGVKLD